METELLYFDVLYVPSNIKISDLFNECNKLNITYDWIATRARTLRFYSKSRTNLRLITTKHILKSVKL